MEINDSEFFGSFNFLPPKQIRPSSGLMGNDRDALKVLMQVHGKLDAEVLDCTHNSGKMWRGIQVCVIRVLARVAVRIAVRVHPCGIRPR